jgi:hypothetical protein
MIRIIQGTYGFRGPDGLVHPKTAASGPFKESAEQEKRLIRLGVAEAVEEPEAPAQEKEVETCPPSKSKSKRTSRARS